MPNLRIDVFGFDEGLRPLGMHWNEVFGSRFEG
jgi:hypothetical protein